MYIIQRKIKGVPYFWNNDTRTWEGLINNATYHNESFARILAGNLKYPDNKNDEFLLLKQ